MFTSKFYVKFCLLLVIPRHMKYAKGVYSFHLFCLSIPPSVLPSVQFYNQVLLRSFLITYNSAATDQKLFIIGIGVPGRVLLQICLIIALSFRSRRWRFGFVNGQVSLAWSIALRTQQLYTRPCVLKERWREERTGSKSLNFFQAVFTRVLVESSQPPAAESMSSR